MRVPLQLFNETKSITGRGMFLCAGCVDGECQKKGSDSAPDRAFSCGNFALDDWKSKMALLAYWVLHAYNAKRFQHQNSPKNLRGAGSETMRELLAETCRCGERR